MAAGANASRPETIRAMYLIPRFFPTRHLYRAMRYRVLQILQHCRSASDPLSRCLIEKQLGAGEERDTVAFDDLKKFRGQVYSGMPVGGTHVWEYPRGIWREQKVAPDRWHFTFRSDKKREHAAPEGSGALPGTRYHWFIVAHQQVEKLDQDTYATVMEGVKYKIAHKRPHWRHWSTDYPDQEPEREILIRILEEELAALKKEAPPGPSGRIPAPYAVVAPVSGNGVAECSGRTDREKGRLR